MGLVCGRIRAHLLRRLVRLNVRLETRADKTAGDAEPVCDSFENIQLRICNITFDPGDHAEIAQHLHGLRRTGLLLHGCNSLTEITIESIEIQFV